MIRLRPQYWLLALLLALATHLAAFLYTVSLPPSEPVWRGGGLFGNGDARFGSGNGVVVRLGPAQQEPDRTVAPPAPPRPAPEPPPLAEPAAKPAPKAEPKPEAPAAPPPAPVPDAAPAKPPAPAAAVPAPKPARPAPSVPAAKAAPPAGPAGPARQKPAPEKPEQRKPEQEKSAATAERRQAATTINRPVSFGGPAGRHGTASGNRDGADRDLTYGDRVMLWLQAHGEYPLQAARYGLEDTVTVEFAINRRGRILYFRLVRESKWYLLNTAVRQMMERSSPVPPFPSDITDDELTFTVPVHFSPP